MSALPIHAWVYGLHKQNATREEYLERAERLGRLDSRGFGGQSLGSEAWRMACGAVFVEENFRVFGPRRLSLFWPLKRAEVTCEACRAVVDPLVNTSRNPNATAYVETLLANGDGIEDRRRAHIAAQRAEEAARLNDTRSGWAPCRNCRWPTDASYNGGRRRAFCDDCRNQGPTVRLRLKRERAKS